MKKLRAPEKKEYIHIRIEADLKKRFFEICQENSINPSELLRKYVLIFIKKDMKNNKKGVDVSSHT